MEKIVTKIGDVTIERRISKSQTLLNTSFDTSISQSNISQLKNSNVTDLSGILDTSQSNLKEDISIHNNNVSNALTLNIHKKPYSFMENPDFKFNNMSEKDGTNNFTTIIENIKQESINADETMHNTDNKPDIMILEKPEPEISKINEIGESLPIQRVGTLQNECNTSVFNHNETDSSGICIEKHKEDFKLQISKSPLNRSLDDPCHVSPSASIEEPSKNFKNIQNDSINKEMKCKIVAEKDVFNKSFELDDLELNENEKKVNSLKEGQSKNICQVTLSDDKLCELETKNFSHSESDDNQFYKQNIDGQGTIGEIKEMKSIQNDTDVQELSIIEDKNMQNSDEAEVSKVPEIKESNIKDFACTDLVELIEKGEIEGEIEDVKHGDIVSVSEEKKTSKRKATDEKNNDESVDSEDSGDEESEDENEEEACLNENEKNLETTEKMQTECGKEEHEKDSKKKIKKPRKKKRKCDKNETGEDGEGGDKDEKDKNIDKSKITNASLRKNIREVMDETKLDEATLAAQRQEAERLKRLQEQQRIIREVQRQIALNRQNQKSQNKVLSLLQGNSQTSILKTSSMGIQVQTTQGSTQNSVLVKLSNGEQTSLDNKKMLEILKNSKSKVTVGKPPVPKTLLRQGMVTPSVSIAPVTKKEPEEDDKKKKKGDIVTLSSDSEDDCIVLSDEDESEPEEDPTNSGMHTNDKYNLPDEKGRIIVNVGHPESESDLYLAPQIARIIKPHQIGGIRFLYDNVIESLERYSSSAGFGCILAHSMGLGKTLQIVSFSDIFLRYTSAKTILCIMPINTIQNWLAEFNMWLPKESTSEEVRCRDFDLFIVNESLKNITSRARVILDWHKSGGVLLMGYELFRLLSLKKSHKSKKKKRDFDETDTKYKELIEEVYSALVIPGPDLVICDEGHRIKNSHATTSQALKQIRTKRRIVLTGYPLQNNLLEYWCMVDFVRPNYLGTKTEFSNMFERPIQNGQCIDSTPQDKRLMRYRAHVLHSLLEGFVQRRSHAVLQNTLPEKEEYVLLLRFTPFQRKLYDTFMNEVVRTVAVPNPLKAFAVCCKIWNHPDVLYNFLKKKGEEIDLDLEEAFPPSLQIPQFPQQQNMGLNASNQPLPTAWPRRGPGSRGGKSRPCTKVGRNRKNALTVPSNATEKQEGSSDFIRSNQFSSNDDFSQGDGSNNFQGRGFNQSQSGYENEFGNQSGFANSSFNKNSLESMGNMSANNFQTKRFFPQQSETGNQDYGNSLQNFKSMQQKTNTNPNNSNESNLNASFDSNLNSSDSSFSQTDCTESFNYNQDFNSEFYANTNYQGARNNSNFAGENRNSGFQSNSTYFQNREFRNPENFQYQSGNNVAPNFPGYDRPSSNFSNPSSNSPFQTTGSGSHQIMNSGQTSTHFQNSPNVGGSFQNSNPNNQNFPANFQSSDSNFEASQYGRNSSFQSNNSNFQASAGRNFQGQNTEPNFQGNTNYEQNFWPQPNWDYAESGSNTGEYQNTSVSNDFVSQKFSSPNENQESKKERKNTESGNNDSAMYDKTNCDYSSCEKNETDDTKMTETKETKAREEEGEKKEDAKSSEVTGKKEDSSLPYDWAMDLFKNYVTGVIENSSKMEVFFHIITESIKLGDRLLVFSQSLLTLDLIESYLHRTNVPGKEEVWTKNKNYFRLDGSTPGLEREKLINEFNFNESIYLFLVSTRAGSLGINLVGANRVVVFDASWNPCHDTQAVCRVYRYGQRKPCFVYRLVMDNCLEKKIYDRQVNKQGMADRVVDELNPDAHLSIKEVTNLCWDDQEDTTVKDYSDLKDKYNDEIIKILLDRCSKLLSKEPFKHESLLIDRKEKKLSQAEKRLAKRSYELEKQAANQPKNMYSFFPNAGQRSFVKPIASVRPMQSEVNTKISPQLPNRSKWIPAEVWQKQGMSAQEMTLPLDVVIPTSSPEKTSIVLKAGQKVMVLKSPKGIYMQLENGKIIAIRSAFKVGQNGPGYKNEEVRKDGVNPVTKPSTNINIPPKIRPGMTKQPFTKQFTKLPEKKLPANTNIIKTVNNRQTLSKAKPFLVNRKFESIASDVKQKMMSGKMGLSNQNEKLNSVEPTEMDDDSIIIEDESDSEKPSSHGGTDSSHDKTENKLDEKCKMTDSLETLRKVTEKITDSAQREENEGLVKYPRTNPTDNYRHGFTSRIKIDPPIECEKKREVMEGGGDCKNQDKSDLYRQQQPPQQQQSPQQPPPQQQLQQQPPHQQPQQQQGNENIPNWLMNQSFSSMDSYNNYFSGYYPYGPGPGSIIPPYDGFYPSNNYANPNEGNSQTTSNSKQPVNIKKSSSQASLPVNPIVKNVQNASRSRNPPVVNASPIYPPYPNPYSYRHYNYPTNTNLNSQGFSFSNDGAQQQANPSCNSENKYNNNNINNSNNNINSGSSASTTRNNNNNNNNSTSVQQNQSVSYDSSMYSAFHRPDTSFQTPENAYSSPYSRSPYSSNGAPAFFPYTSPYPNYPYGHNYNPYVHPPGYGYSMPCNQGANNVGDKGSGPSSGTNSS